MGHSFFAIIAIIVLVLVFGGMILSLVPRLNSYPPIRVFISYSKRSPQWEIFLERYLFPVFKFYNITYYEYLKSKAPGNEQIRALIDAELEKADVYIRCLDEQLQPIYIIDEEVERYEQGRKEDFLYYETQEASHYLNSPKIRIILALDAERLGYTLDERTAHVIYISSFQNPLLVSRIVAKKIHGLYESYILQSQQYSPKNTVDWLIKSLRFGNIGIRENAAYRLGQIGDVRAVEPLIDVLHDNNWRVRGMAVGVLVEIGIPAVEPLILALRHEDWGFRDSIVRILGDIGDSKAVETLIAKLDDEHYQVRRHAAIALAKIKDARAIRSLEELAQTDTDEQVRQAAHEALTSLNKERDQV